MANQSLINNKVDLITTKLIDLHGRKVTGASPSSQPTDYVIRSEITSLLPQSSNAPTAAPTSFTYSLYVSGTLAIDDDIANRLYVTNKVQPKIVRADVKIAPTGNDIIVNINLAGSAWMSLTIKGGTTSSQVSGSLSALNGPGFLSLDITKVGSTLPGADLVVTIGA